MKKQKRIVSLSSPIRLSFSFYPLSVAYGIIIALSFIYLLFSVASSQSFSPCLEELEYYRRPETIYNCVKKTADTTYFNSFFERYKNYIPLIKEDLEREKNMINNLIGYYESFVVYNQKSRDILMTLSELYAYKNDIVRSNYYYSQAKNIDPRVNK